MKIEFISNCDNGIFTKLTDILKLYDGKKIIVLGLVEDSVYHKLEDFIDCNASIFLSVDKKYTTKLLLDELLKRENVYVCDNNLNDGRNVNNFVLVENGDNVECLLCGFPLTENNLTNSSSFAVYFAGKSDEIVNFDLVRELYNDKNERYERLTANFIDELAKRKAFRNEKAATICNELDEDEIVMSFRNVDRILKERQREIKVQDLVNKKSEPVDEIEIEFNLD